MAGATDPVPTLNNQYTVGKKFTFSCLSSYTREGTNGKANFEVECENNGQWNIGSLACKGTLTIKMKMIVIGINGVMIIIIIKKKMIIRMMIMIVIRLIKY